MNTHEIIQSYGFTLEHTNGSSRHYFIRNKKLGMLLIRVADVKGIPSVIDIDYKLPNDTGYLGLCNRFEASTEEELRFIITGSARAKSFYNKKSL